jgi:hypothetical protein
MPRLSNWLSGLTKLTDGECWQNIDDTTGAITVKTVNRPSKIGSLLLPPTVSVWRVNKGYTFNDKTKACTADAKNIQLTIPGNILTKGAVWRGVQTVKPIVKVEQRELIAVAVDPRNPREWVCDVWDATLPNNEGSVTYYLLHGTTRPFISNYRLVGKPPVWAQYHSFVPGVNAPSNYDPNPACRAVARSLQLL